MIYEVQFLEGVPFKFEENYTYKVLPRASTVIVKTINVNGKASIKRYGFVDREEIYSLIETGQRINLNHCYIAGFSLAEYKEKMNMNKESKVFINFNDARYAFFDTEESLERAIHRELYSEKYVLDDKEEKFLTVDFTGAQFGNSIVFFTGAQFGDGDVIFEDIQFCGGVIFAETQFGNGSVYFGKTQFGNGFAKAQFGNKNVDFRRANFGDGDVSFYNAVFCNSKVDFINAQFGKGAVDFTGAQFDGNVYFEGTHFGDGTVSFNSAQFDDVSFGRARFGDGTVSFFGTDFDGEVSFGRAEFSEGNVTFSRAKFMCDVYFVETKFGDGDLDFYQSKIRGELDFSNAKFGDGVVNFSSINIDCIKENKAVGATITIKDCYLRDHINMQNAKWKIIRIENCTIEKTLNLEGLDVEKLSLKNTKNLGQVFLRWKEDKVVTRLDADSSQDMAAQLVILKENFHTIGRYDDEDMAYVIYKQYEWKAKYEDLCKGKIYLVPLHFLKKITYDWISEYGTNYMRVSLFMIIIWAIFTLIYCLIPGQLYKSDVVYSVSYIPKISECISYSIATFITIGYGNITPLTKFAVALSGLEGFSGVFLTAYFTVAFARKVLR